MLNHIQVAVLEVERLASLTGTLLTSAQGTEVLSSLGDSVVEELLGSNENMSVSMNAYCDNWGLSKVETVKIP